MLLNKLNMLLETVSFLFLVPRSDNSQPRRTTSECNEHTYGCWRMIQSDLNIEQLVRIVDKTRICFDAIYSGGLVAARSNCTLKGYLSTFHKFVESFKKTASSRPASGQIHVDLKYPAVDQCWAEVRGMIEAVNVWVTPFLNLFRVEDGSG
jgi:hypothetical protein